MTPIVLTENVEEEEGTATTLPPAEASAAGGVMEAAHPDSLGRGGESQPSAASPAEAEDDPGAKGPLAVDDGDSAAADTHANKLLAERGAPEERENRVGVSAEAIAPPANTRTSSPAPGMSTDEAMAVGTGLPLPPTTVARANPGAAKMLSSANQVVAGATIGPLEKMDASHRCSLAAGAAEASDSGQHQVSRTVAKPTEQLFMEDTQLYLGCVACGVKYLVEAVDPAPSRSTQGGCLRKAVSSPDVCVHLSQRMM